jgi:excisionase family DNA binding protein
VKDILTTFEIARLCKVDITTVINWIDAGKLRAYKTPGQHRRVRTDDFLTFVRDYRLPVPRGIARTAVLVTADGDMRDEIRRKIKKHWPKMMVSIADDGFTAGKMLAEKQPSLFIVDVQLPGIDAASVCRAVTDDRRLKGTRIITVQTGAGAAMKKNLLASGADYCLPAPFSIPEFTAAVKKILG